MNELLGGNCYHPTTANDATMPHGELCARWKVLRSLREQKFDLGMTFLTRRYLVLEE